MKTIASAGVAVTLLAAIGGATAARAQTIDGRREYYEGCRTWIGVYKATNNPDNISRIQFNTPTKAVYCHDRCCWNVTIEKASAAT